jgi:dihydropteroate synthase
MSDEAGVNNVQVFEPTVMGVLNVTPDSFSDGGRYTDVDAAIAHGLAMRADGADLVDVGGESTRPGADRVAAPEEITRVLPVIRELAEAGCPWILMHWRGHSRDMNRLAVYSDVVAEVREELLDRVAAAEAAGVAPERIIVDPGLGFAKTAEHNWTLTRHLDVLVGLGYPVLFAASRKSYLGRLLAGPDGHPRPVGDREAATLATSVLAFAAGVWGVRVHDVRATSDARAVWRASGGPRIKSSGGTR